MASPDEYLLIPSTLMLIAAFGENTQYTAEDATCNINSEGSTEFVLKIVLENSIMI